MSEGTVITPEAAAAANPIIAIIKFEVVAHELGHLLAAAFLDREPDSTYTITPKGAASSNVSQSMTAWASTMRTASDAAHYIITAGGPLAGAGYASRIGFAGDPPQDAWRSQSGLTLLARAMRATSTSRTDIEQLLAGQYQPQFDPILKTLWLAGMQMYDRIPELELIAAQLRTGAPMEFTREGVLEFAPADGPDVDLIAGETQASVKALETQRREAAQA